MTLCLAINLSLCLHKLPLGTGSTPTAGLEGTHEF
jgi:hypothetical protein